jgi:hypothetical protein
MPRIELSPNDLPDPKAYEQIGFESRLVLKCHYFIDTLVFDHKLCNCVVEDSPGGGKTYVIVFEGGGTCEFDIKEEYLELMDSHGVDFSWAGNGVVHLSPHRPSTAPGSRSFWGREEGMENKKD